MRYFLADKWRIIVGKNRIDFIDEKKKTFDGEKKKRLCWKGKKTLRNKS